MNKFTDYEGHVVSARAFLQQARECALTGDTWWRSVTLRWAGNQRRKALALLKSKKPQMTLF